MAVLWLIIGAIAGGWLGWKLGGYNSRHPRDCNTPTWGITSNPWSGAIFGAILGLILATFISAAV